MLGERKEFHASVVDGVGREVVSLETEAQRAHNTAIDAETEGALRRSAPFGRSPEGGKPPMDGTCGGIELNKML